MTNSRRFAALLALTTAGACEPAVQRVDVVAATPASSPLHSLNGVMLGMRPDELKNIRQGATFAPYSGYTETVDIRVIKYRFPMTIEQEAQSGDSRLESVTAERQVANDSSMTAAFRESLAAVIASGRTPAACIAPRESSATPNLTVEFEPAGGAYLQVGYFSSGDGRTVFERVRLNSADSSEAVVRRPCTDRDIGRLSS